MNTTNTFMNKKAITDLNVKEYVLSHYGTDKCTNSKKIDGITPQLQKNYGGINDCTLMSITVLIDYITKGNAKRVNEIYNKVEAIAKSYFYNHKIGFSAPFIKPTLEKALKQLFKIKKTFKFCIGKNMAFNFSTIKNAISNNRPIIITIHSDGRNYYKKHSVLIIGYSEYGSKAKMLMVYDNWTRSVCYVDYNRMGICFIIY